MLAAIVTEILVILQYTLVLVTAAGSPIAVNFFTDNECGIASNITASASVTVDECVVTPGLGSVIWPATPCTGAYTTIVMFGFSDQHCAKDWGLDWGRRSGRCYGAWSSGAAFGSILFSCHDQTWTPQPAGTTTVDVGYVATGAAPSATAQSDGTSSGGSSNSSSGSSSNSSSTHTTGGGWSSLTSGERIGIIVALAMGIPTILIALFMCCLKILR